MATNELRVGAEVYSNDGTCLGKVRRLFSAEPEAVPPPQTSGGHDAGSSWAVSEGKIGNEAGYAERESSATLAMNRATAVDGGAAVGGVPLEVDEAELGFSGGQAVAFGPSDTKYLEVHHGGLLHRHSESFYVPFVAVKVIENDGSIVLRYTTDEVAHLFSQPPPSGDN